MEHAFGRSIDKFIIRIFLIILIVICINTGMCYSQDIKGAYKDEQGYYLAFYPDNQVEFLLLQSTGLGDTKVAGHGNFCVRKDKIIIRTKSGYLGGSQSSYTYIASNSSTANIFEFTVVDELEQPILGVNITFKIKNKISGIVTSSNGNAKFNLAEMPNDSLLQVSLLGYQTLRIKLQGIEGGNFKVKLMQGNLDFVDDKKITLNYKISKDTIFCSYMNDKQVLRLIRY